MTEEMNGMSRHLENLYQLSDFYLYLYKVETNSGMKLWENINHGARTRLIVLRDLHAALNQRYLFFFFFLLAAETLLFMI